MCDFPSWIEQDDGTIIFLTDSDIDRLPPTLPKERLPWHEALRTIYPNAGGKDREGFPCPAPIIEAIRAGQMTRMARAGGYERVRVPCDGETLTVAQGDLVIVTGGTVFIDGQTGGDCWARTGGIINSTGQTGGDCRANTGGIINSTGQTGGDCWAYDGGIVKKKG